jgi:membrane fusion protein, heavy metal efflux system
MIGRISIAVLASALGMALASFVPQIPAALHWLASIPGLESKEAQNVESGKKTEGETGDDVPTALKLKDTQIENAGIEVAPVEDGTLSHRIIVPGTIVPNADRIAQVSVKLSGAVTELRKKVGDNVAKGEVIAVLESRDLAAAKSEYLAARLNSDLQKNLYARDKDLWARRVIAEQQVLKSESAAAQARINIDTARQKLIVLGLTDQDIADLPNQPEAALRRQEIVAPIAGRVVERKVDLGSAVGRDNLESELFTIVNLDRVWIDLAVGPGDLPLVAEGQTVSIAAHGLAKRTIGKIIFISPMLDRETHSARVVAEIANSDGNWRPGSLITGTIAIDERRVALAVPASALQSIGDAQVVFVRVADGFEKRLVRIGQSDDDLVEILAGVAAGEMIAVTNTFALKAELMKSLAEEN